MDTVPKVGAVVVVLAVVIAGGVWGPRWIGGPGAPEAQRPLALPRDPAVNAPVERGSVRVVLVDGLGRDDVAQVPAYAAVCARGLELVVDAGFPTKSMAIQLALWTGLTAQQLGAPVRNEWSGPPPPGALPPRVPGSRAVVEAYRSIALAAGFAVEPEPRADREDATADPAAVQAWRDGGFAAAAGAAVAGDAPLVLVHVLAVDEAAHDGGRGTARHRAALAAADGVVARAVAAVPAGALLIVMADHGHLARGGHGDAEDVVRRVRACLAPAPAGITASARGAEIHLVDLARVIADRLGVQLEPRAVGRPLADAVRAPDRDATLPRPAAWRWTLALALAALMIAFGAYRLGRAAWVWSWPLLAYAIYRVAIGAPSLSAMPSALVSAATAAPLVMLVVLALRRHGRRALVLAVVAPAVMVTMVFAILSRIPDAIVTGVSPRAPWWTAHLAWSAQVLAVGVLVGCVAVLCPERGRPAPPSAVSRRDKPM